MMGYNLFQKAIWPPPVQYHDKNMTKVIFRYKLQHFINALSEAILQYQIHSYDHHHFSFVRQPAGCPYFSRCLFMEH